MFFSFPLSLPELVHTDFPGVGLIMGTMPVCQCWNPRQHWLGQLKLWNNDNVILESGLTGMKRALES